MKYIVFPVILSFIFFSCQKEDSKIDYNATNDNIEKVDSAQYEVLGDVIVINEVKPEQLSLDIKNKTNDTLYVTNFFATWCGPCMIEIPHFKEKMEELKGKPVKFTFVSLDNKTDWETSVSDFADEYDLRKNVVLLDGSLLKEDFFSQNFKTWTGEAIPFTLITKGNVTDEFMGSMTKDQINEKIDKLLALKSTNNN